MSKDINHELLLYKGSLLVRINTILQEESFSHPEFQDTEKAVNALIKELIKSEGKVEILTALVRRY